MAKVSQEQREFKKAIRKHMLAVLASGVPRSELGLALGVTRQAISSYLRGRTAPKPHIVKRLLTKWPASLEYRNAQFGPEAFGAEVRQRPAIVPLQGELFKRLCSVTPQDMKFEVRQDDVNELELKLSIKIGR